MIDIFFYIIMLLAVIRGWRKGLIIALIFNGLRIDRTGCSCKIISGSGYTYEIGPAHDNPLVARDFLYSCFYFGDFDYSWVGRLLEKLIKWVLLEWLNKLGGILLFLVLYLSVYSIFLFYGAETQIISKQAVNESHFYSLIAPFGPAVIRFITGFIPFGQDMFMRWKVFLIKSRSDIH